MLTPNTTDAACSFASYYFTRHALYWQLIRDCYEALVIASFFFLLVSYLSNPVPTAEDPHPRPYATRYERAAQLRTSVKDIHLVRWMWPLGRWRWRPAKGGPEEGEVNLPSCLLDLGTCGSQEGKHQPAGVSLVDARVHRSIHPRPTPIDSRRRRWPSNRCGRIITND